MMEYKIKISKVYKAEVYVDGHFHREAYSSSKEYVKRLALDYINTDIVLKEYRKAIKNGRTPTMITSPSLQIPQTKTKILIEES